MAILSASVVSFTNGSPVTYTTSVALSKANTYSLALRYSAFHAAYAKLVELDPTFVFDFPKKGGFFSSPPPEERQPQLDAFIQAALQHLAEAESSASAKLIGVVEELLQVPAHQEASGKDNGDETENAETHPSADSETESSDSNAEESSNVVEPSAEPVVEAVFEETHVKIVAETVEETQPKIEVETVEDKQLEIKEETVIEAVKVVEEESVVTKEEIVVKAQFQEVVEPAPVTVIASTTTTTTSTTTLLETSEMSTITTTPPPKTKKKKTLTAEQKRLRNMRRKEKRKKSTLKIRGEKHEVHTEEDE